MVLALALTGSYHYLRETVSVSSNVNGRELPIYSVETEEKKIALSFDAAWGNEDTKQILDILKKHDVKAAFFITGHYLNTQEELVKRIIVILFYFLLLDSGNLQLQK